jgi:hypothetical protein
MAYEHSPLGQNADADYCEAIAKIDPYEYPTFS